ncbi:MAG: helix-turn-helix transcriptional regulator [Oscillospiraceae bacterium]|nr:helix-turn-helix transcriptional regulator [Oscillospiraceae bacterium]MDE6102990.1 helix-turn-helix transcriptional regulator [Oscillospiraceae bacterium]
MNNAQLAKMIKEICKSKGISVSKMLSECGIRKGLIYDLEKRDWTPSVAIAEQIANYLDCSIDYLMGRTDNPDSHKK